MLNKMITLGIKVGKFAKKNWIILTVLGGIAVLTVAFLDSILETVDNIMWKLEEFKK